MLTIGVGQLPIEAAAIFQQTNIIVCACAFKLCCFQSLKKVLAKILDFALTLIIPSPSSTLQVSTSSVVQIIGIFHFDSGHKKSHLFKCYDS